MEPRSTKDALPNPNPDISVIIPVYNTDPALLRRCVRSAAQQQVDRDFEIIVVDDGSTPLVASAIDGLAAMYPCLRVERSQNRGVASARNLGMTASSARRVCFLDADDYLQPTFLARSIQIMERNDADVVFGGLDLLEGGDRISLRSQDPQRVGNTVAQPRELAVAAAEALSSTATRQPTMLTTVANVVASMYDRDLAMRVGFAEGVSHGEDRLFNAEILCELPRVVFSTEAWYVYDKTSSKGATERADARWIGRLTATVMAYSEFRDKLVRGGLPAELQESISEGASQGVLNYLKVISGIAAAINGPFRASPTLRRLAKQPSVRRALECRGLNHRPWRDLLFLQAARLGSGVLMGLLGWIWVKSGGLGAKGISEAARIAPGEPRNLQ